MVEILLDLRFSKFKLQLLLYLLKIMSCEKNSLVLKSCNQKLPSGGGL